MDSEFRQFILAIKRLGIPYELDYNVTKEGWQKTILKEGYNYTSAACFIVTVGGVDWLFGTSPIGSTKQDENVGPGGLLLFGRNRTTGEILKRRVNNGDSGFEEIYNVDAVMKSYPGVPWHTCAHLRATA